jgi:hypothetical protein
MKEHSGIVTNDASTTQFTFVVSPLKNRAQIEKNDYIALDHPTLRETCPILAITKEIRSYEHVAGSTLGEKVGKMMATAEIIGYVNLNDRNKQIQTLVAPPNPGSRVYLLYSEFLQEIYTTDIHGKPFNPPLYIGKTAQTAINQKEDSKQLNFYLDPKSVTNAHTLITALDNSGKTHTATVIIEELTHKTEQPIVVFDPYDEYKTITAPKKQEYEINSKTTNNTANQKTITKEKLMKLIQPKQVTTITAKKETPENKTTLYSHILSTLWEGRLKEPLPPFTLVIENAEKIDPIVLEEVVYEGTKYGLALIVISKQPTKLGRNILSQMNTQIIGKTTDSNYLNSLKDILPKHAAEIPQLKEKEWIINTNSQQQTTKITTRERLTK